MDAFTSRKLVSTLGAIGAIVGIILVIALLEGTEALTQQVTVLGMEASVLFWALLLIGGLGGFNVLRQARLDEMEELEEEIVPEPDMSPQDFRQLEDAIIDDAVKEAIERRFGIDPVADNPEDNGDPAIIG